ncbi:bZIP transcription factor 53-like [Cornus florida]|uniref:bZIP transcription factor 53-like n=1 Tax=Cornus florida TaxID=4283 RepID=UPI0028A02E5B|nr:bZIP transcription factor 53-like [Cornus florida]
MSALQQVSSSSTLEVDQKIAVLDERKRKRMISNRESARRSRIRKQKLVEDLTNEARLIQDANKGIVGKIDKATEMCVMYAAENNVLRAQVMELTERLRGLNDVIQWSGLDVAEDIPDPLLKPWQILSSSQPIMASSDFLHQF